MRGGNRHEVFVAVMTILVAKVEDRDGLLSQIYRRSQHSFETNQLSYRFSYRGQLTGSVESSGAGDLSFSQEVVGKTRLSMTLVVDRN